MMVEREANQNPSYEVEKNDLCDAVARCFMTEPQQAIALLAQLRELAIANGDRENAVALTAVTCA